MKNVGLNINSGKFINEETIKDIVSIIKKSYKKKKGDTK